MSDAAETPWVNNDGGPRYGFIEQIVDGIAVGVNTTAMCVNCKREVRAGEDVTVYAYWPLEDTWNVANIRCADCERAGITHPTLGFHEAELRGRLATLTDSREQSHRVVVIDTDLVSFSAPDEGSEP